MLHQGRQRICFETAAFYDAAWSIHYSILPSGRVRVWTAANKSSSWPLATPDVWKVAESWLRARGCTIENNTGRRLAAALWEKRLGRASWGERLGSVGWGQRLGRVGRGERGGSADHWGQADRRGDGAFLPFGS